MIVRSQTFVKCPSAICKNSEKHIPGDINIANESIGTEDISELPGKDQLILVYCRSGNRSKQVLWSSIFVTFMAKKYR